MLLSVGLTAIDFEPRPIATGVFNTYSINTYSMKWLDEYPNVLPSVRPVESNTKIELLSDGPYAEAPDLPEELASIPLYAWLLPAKRIPQKYIDLFRKYSIPLLE